MAVRKSAIPPKEQETVIQIDRLTRKAYISTTDTRMMNKLDKKYERKNTHKSNGQITELEYEVPETCISFRSAKRKDGE